MNNTEVIKIEIPCSENLSLFFSNYINNIDIIRYGWLRSNFYLEYVYKDHIKTENWYEAADSFNYYITATLQKYNKGIRTHFITYEGNNGNNLLFKMENSKQ